MKKMFLRIGVLMVAICIFFTGCKETEVSKNKNNSSKPEASSSVTEITKAPTYNDYSHYFNPHNFSGGRGYMFETETYVFYRNNADNGYLYRLNKETNEKKVVFNKNANSVIYGIKVKGEQLYFVTKTAADTYTSIYTTDLEGGNLKRLAENVESYVLSDDAIYYIGNEMASNPYVYKYSLSDGTTREIHSEGSGQLNLANDKLYFISGNEIGSQYIMEYDTKTDTPKKIMTFNEGIAPERYSVYHDNKLYFEGTIKSTEENRKVIALFDIENQKTEIIFDEKELNDYYSEVSLRDFVVNSDGSVFAQIGVTVDGNGESKTRIFHITEDAINFCGEMDKSGLLHYCDGEFLIFDFNNSSDALIAGNDKYNEVVS